MLGVGITGPTGGSVIHEDTIGSERPDRVVDTIRATPAAEERDAWAVLAGVRGLGPVGFGALLRRYGNAIAILREGASGGGQARLAQTLNDLDGGRSRGEEVSDDLAAGIAAATQTAGATLERIRKVGLTIVILDDPTFPMRLASIENCDPPTRPDSTARVLAGTSSTRPNQSSACNCRLTSPLEPE